MTVNPLIKVDVNKVEKRTMFRIKKRYYLDILMP